MISLCRCTQCKKSGHFDVTLKFDHEIQHCNECHNIKTLFYTYLFCNVDCLFSWLNDKQIEKLGFPCQSCANHKNDFEPTGFLAGHESNGICTTCNGSKRIKEGKLPWKNN
jgi:hypothetical protein